MRSVIFDLSPFHSFPGASPDRRVFAGTNPVGERGVCQGANGAGRAFLAASIQAGVPSVPSANAQEHWIGWAWLRAGLRDNFRPPCSSDSRTGTSFGIPYKLRRVVGSRGDLASLSPFVWIEPALVAEWIRIIKDYLAGQRRPVAGETFYYIWRRGGRIRSATCGWCGSWLSTS